jgi:TRAP-type C4-dicarboxylate transport system substrate-binding protein
VARNPARFNGPEYSATAVTSLRGGTKASGRDRTHAVVLTIADHESERRDLKEYIAAVHRLSGGSIRLVPKAEWRVPQLHYDRGTLADVRTGKVDLAKIGVGSFDTLGVRDLDALTAPFLVDSVALEERVLRSPVVATMLAGVNRLGVVGVALLPGEPLRPFRQRRRFLAPSDYRGASIGVTLSRVSATTLAAVGAKPRNFVSDDLPYSFAGAELDLATIDGSGYDTNVTSLTGNVVLSPRGFVVVGNRQALARLTPDSARSSARRAARHSRRRSGGWGSRRRTKLGILCRRKQMALVEATPSDLALCERPCGPFTTRSIGAR